MRIATKRLLYTLETFLPAYGENMAKSLEAIKRIQQLLGEMHDCNVWFSYLQQFIGKEEKERGNTTVTCGLSLYCFPA